MRWPPCETTVICPRSDASDVPSSGCEQAWPRSGVRTEDVVELVVVEPVTTPVRRERNPERPRAGTQVGVWVLRSRLGNGGNGDVWKAVGPDNSVVAVKLLRTPRDRERMARFRQEVRFLVSDPNREGVLGILDSDLAPARGRPWYAMPLAALLASALGKDPAVEAVVEAFVAYSATLARLHEEGIGHRDLKPANLFKLGERWAIGDFGLVQHPEKEPLTKAGRRLGPIDFMAPEMRMDADSADPQPADVYALAKTLWVALTGSELPQPGPHRPDDPAYALAARLDHAWAVPVDSLLRRATFADPDSRVTMAGIHSELAALTTPGSAAHEAADIIEIANVLQRFGEPERQQAESAAALEQRLNQSSGPPHDALHAAWLRLSELLPTWSHDRRSDESGVAYRLLEPSHWPQRGQRGREDSFSVRHPTIADKTITIRIAVAVRLKGDGETLVIGGGVTFQEYVATTPEWVRSVVREVPLSSALEMAAVADLRNAYVEGVDSALRLARNSLM
jgi:serine/threonine protein kinase